MKKNLTNKFLSFFTRRLRWVIPFWYGFTIFVTRQRKVSVTVYKELKEIPIALDYGRDWRSDPLKGALDVCMHPTKFQKRMDKATFGQHDKLGDCDDHAMYWCVALLKSGLAQKVWFSSFQYWDDKTIGGHAVCSFEDSDGQLWWCDYHMPEKMSDKWGFAIQGTSKKSAELINATQFEITLGRNDTPKWGKSDGMVFI